MLNIELSYSILFLRDIIGVAVTETLNSGLSELL